MKVALPRCTECGGDMAFYKKVSQIMVEAYDDVAGVCVRNAHYLVEGRVYQCKICKRKVFRVREKERLMVEGKT